MEHAISDVCDLACMPVVLAAILGDDHIVEDGPQLFPREPQQHLGGGWLRE